MRWTRWFRVVHWELVVASLRDAAREAPRRKPPRPTVWPELLEDRTLPSGLTPPPAFPVEPGGADHAPAARQGQPADPGPGQAPAQSNSQSQPADPGPGQAPAQSNSQGNQGAGDQPHTGPDQQGGPSASGKAGDGGNGNQVHSSGADPGNEKAVRGLGGDGQEGGQQEAPRAAISRDQGAGGGENRPVEAFGAGAASGAPATADGAGALVGNDVGAPLSSADAEPNAGLSTGALPGATLPADTVDLALLPRASLLNEEADLSGGSALLDFSQFMDGDGAFLELWDKDQLLFPDSVPKVDEIQFPGGLPWQRDMPLPDRTPNQGGPLPLGERPVEALILAGAVGEVSESAPAPPNGQEAVAVPALAAVSARVAALSSPDGIRPETSPMKPMDASNAPADPRDTDWAKDPMRPYKIALGALPFLPAFGFTALTLRDRVQAGVRLWQGLRGRRPCSG